MGVVVWGYRGGVGALRIPYKLSTFGKFRYMVHACYTHYIVAHILHDAGGMRGLTGTLTKPLALYRNLHVATCIYIYARNK